MLRLSPTVFAAVLILIAHRLYAGMLDKIAYNETTYLIQFPIWWAYAASLFASCMAAVVAFYVAIVRTNEFITGRIELWDGVEGEQ